VLKFRESKPVDVHRSFAPVQDDKTVPETASKRMFRRELQRKYFISRLSELPEGLKAVLCEMRYRAYGESLVTNRNKLIELPAEALGGDSTNSLLRQLLKKNFYFLLKRSSNKLFLKTSARNKNSPSRILFLRRQIIVPPNKMPLFFVTLLKSS